MKMCTRTGCPQAAVYQAGVRMWAMGCPKKPQFCAEGTFTIYSCVTHSQEIMDLDFMTDAGWAAIATRFKIAKLAPPARSTAEGFLVEIASGKRTYRDDPSPH